VDTVELRVPIRFWFLTAQIVARDSAKPDGVVEIETRADLVEPFEESVLLGCFFFYDSEWVAGLGQRPEELTAQRIRRFAAFDAISPFITLIRLRRSLPAKVASTFRPASSCSENIPALNFSTTVPNTSIPGSFSSSPGRLNRPVTLFSPASSNAPDQEKSK
jgi:hypothetical protein